MKWHLHVHLKSKFSEITFSLTALSDTHSCCSKVPIPARCTFKRTPAVCTVTGCWMNSSTKTNHLYGGSFSEALLKGRMNYTAFNHVTGTGLLGINWESKLFSCCLCSRPLWLTADELTGFFPMNSSVNICFPWNSSKWQRLKKWHITAVWTGDVVDCCKIRGRTCGKRQVNGIFPQKCSGISRLRYDLDH